MQRKRKLIKFCDDCEMPSTYHLQTWLDELINRFLPRLSLPKKFELFFDILLEKSFIFSKLVSLRDDFTRSDIQLRTTCFIDEARKRGIKFKVLYGPFGYTNYFQAEINGKIFRFEGLPIADFASKHEAQLVDDKKRTKCRLRKKNFPIADGKAFWFWQKKQAVEFGVNHLRFPLVVKPCRGSASKHVTTNIQDIERLKYAINKAIIYSPAFIIERFIPDASVHRATVIDFNFVACVKQAPANVVGNGSLTIRELIDRKNNDPCRGQPFQKEFTLYKIVEDETTRNLLAEKGYNLSIILKEGEIVYLQKDSFLKLGGDLLEVTPQVHPDNIQLFRDIAKLFDIRVVGIDFLCQNISDSWKNQQCAVLELNSIPCIELHHFPSSGIPQNVAKAIVDLFFKYYL
jgi:cyanophycin synthetase